MSKKPYVPMRVSIEENGTKKCNFGGCDNNRYKMSQYCTLHYSRDSRWNDPKFTLPTAREIEYTRKYAHQIIKRNIDHPSIQDAMNKLDTIAMFEVANKDNSIARHARRLASGFNKQIVLQNILMYWLWCWEVGLRIHNVQNELAVRDAVIGNALLRGASQYEGDRRTKPPSGRVRKYFGEIIVRELNPILNALKERVDKQKALEATARLAEERAEREKIELHYPQRVITLAHKVLEQELKTTNKLKGMK